MTLAAIARSLTLAPLIRGLESPLFWLCAAIAFIGLLFPAKSPPRGAEEALWFVCAPFLEEFTWRTLLQSELSHIFRDSRFLGLPNIVASAGFAGAHIAVAPSLIAALTFFPSLILGGLWTLFRSTWLCALLHLWYNFVFRFL